MNTTKTLLKNNKNSVFFKKIVYKTSKKCISLSVRLTTNVQHIMGKNFIRVVGV